MEFDFTQEVEFRVKTNKGESLMREPSAPEYMTYLKEISDDSLDGEAIYNKCIDYLVNLGGDEKVLKTLSYQKISNVIQGVNGEGAVKK